MDRLNDLMDRPLDRPFSTTTTPIGTYLPTAYKSENLSQAPELNLPSTYISQTLQLHGIELISWSRSQVLCIHKLLCQIERASG